ncbi:MAG TPA: hypothetical protein VMV92_44380 [Streptosporangiaceae bacterium]|nr:hypothetical protein [Streptosporangiaceae bacterium]HVB44864.1 hypothetical protein [Streptosporangiaceae bacterium]
MGKIAALTGLAALAIAGCGGSTPAAQPGPASPSEALASSHPPSVPGPAPAAGVACQRFRAATSAEARSDPAGTDIASIKAYGDALIRATRPLNRASPDPDPALASALGLAGAANLAIAVGYAPHGLQKAYQVATSAVTAVGRKCKALGY